VPVLAAVAVLAAALGWAGGLLIDGGGRTLPRVPPSAPTVLLLFTAILLALALTTRSRLNALRERRPDARGIEALTVARYGVLARASSPVAAGVAGLYAGYALFLLGDLEPSGREARVVMSGAAVVAALALVAAALFLERVCRLPNRGDQPPNGDVAVIRKSAPPRQRSRDT
jgi:4-amino-4-deoxy-L-arabinose transferase-like glycosyltransferase